VECGRSKETAHRSDLAGWAEYGYCASHSRFFWGLRLHLVATLGGLPVGFALTGAKADERQTLLSILAADPTLAATRPGQTLIADRQYYGGGLRAPSPAPAVGHVWARCHDHHRIVTVNCGSPDARDQHTCISTSSRTDPQVFAGQPAAPVPGTRR
jgi:Transposase DDE domain